MKLDFKSARIGSRIIKSSVGVMLCYAVYLLRGKSGIPFYSMLAVLWCIQPYTNKTLAMALQRTVGTIIGAVYGLITILLEIYILPVYDNVFGYIINALMIIPVLYTTVMLNKKNASYFSCVVFLSITVIHLMDSNPFIFVLNRVIDTFIGIGIGLVVNSARLPRKRVTDCLFVAELDDMLSPVTEELQPYTTVEINRMIDEGLNFTIATMRTPASLMKPLSEIHLKLPVVVMNGAALYDIKENSYVMAYIISNSTCEAIREIISSENMNFFTNALRDDTLMIYYDRLENEAEKSIYSELKRSPYRNYVNLSPPPEDRVIYLMIVDTSEKISALYKRISESEVSSFVKILCYPSDDYKGYSYIKIYNKNADKEKMLHSLSEICETTGITAIGAKPDSKIERRDLNAIARELKKTFEPLCLNPFKKANKPR